MAHYAIGDVQGCYTELMALLKKIDFNETKDVLWFAGDLINGGKENLAVLRFISQLPKKPIVVLGNHDLHFLAVFHKIRDLQPDDTFSDLLNAPDAEALCHWLQQQSIAHYDSSLNYLMIHAGILPSWTISDTQHYAHDIEHQLHSKTPKDIYRFLMAIFGIEQDTQAQQWQFHTDVFTRIRFCDTQGNLNCHYKGTIANAPSELYPWFDYRLNQYPLWSSKNTQPVNVLFGHWAALEKESLINYPHLFALDTGCAWGGYLSALRLEDKQWFQVRGKKYR